MNLYDEIAKVAFELFKESGRIEGRALDNWLEAERIVIARHASQETEEPEETIVIEEIEVKEPIIVEEAEITKEAEEIKPAKKVRSVKKAAKGKKEAPRKEVRKVAKKTIRKK
jgi:hypothetical protein